MALNYTDASGNAWAVDNAGNLTKATKSGTYGNTLDGSNIALYIGGSTSSALLAMVHNK